MPKRKTLYALAEPDIVTRAFCVRRLRRAPEQIENALGDMESQRSGDATPLVIAGEIVCLWLEDFLAMPDAGEEPDDLQSLTVCKAECGARHG